MRIIKQDGNWESLFGIERGYLVQPTQQNLVSKACQVNSKKPDVFESTCQCPSCACINENSARYCEECGTALHQPAHCPNCSAIARPHADICEVCGEWLLNGQCMFCYAPVDVGETFCGECGNPAAGIICQKCGKLSHFDFCSTCNIPLSYQAKVMVLATADDPALLELAALFEGLADAGKSTDTDTIVPISSEHVESTPKQSQAASFASEEALRLKEYRESQQKSKQEHQWTQPQQQKSLFSCDQKERISQLDNEVFEEEERRRIEEERRQEEERRRLEEIERKLREEEERKRLEEERCRQEEERKREHERRLQQQLSNAMSKLSGKTFSSNQEARRFFMSFIAGLPEELAKKITNRGMGWRCNAYGAVHDSPSGCADPSRGGVWLVR